MEKVKQIFLIFIFIFCSRFTYSQIPSGNLKGFIFNTLNKDQLSILSDDYLKSGLGIDEYTKSFIFREINQSELEKVRSFLKMSSKNKIDKDFENGNMNPQPTLKSDARAVLKAFGSDLFDSSIVKFIPNTNLATPSSYIIGPGDKIQVQIYGNSQNNFELVVSRDGIVTIPQTGNLPLSGLSVEGAKALLKQKLSKRYIGLTGANPNTFIDVSLIEFRSIQINVLGEVQRPGSYNLSSLSNVFNALILSGGPNKIGTYRNIEIIRENKKVGTFDIYELIREGRISATIRLEDNDVVLVPPAKLNVEVSGEIKIPGIYEMRDSESIETLLSYCGGFTDNAYEKSVSLTRKGEFKNMIKDVLKSEWTFFKLLNGDKLTIRSKSNLFENRIKATGSFNFPGEFELKPKMRVSDLIEMAGGIKEIGIPARANLIRTKPDYTQEIILLDIRKIFNNLNDSTNLELANEDVLDVLNKTDFEIVSYLTLNGQVISPGVYPFTPGINLNDIIKRAGGLKKMGSQSKVEVLRYSESLGEKELVYSNNLKIDSNGIVLNEIPLRPFDIINLLTSYEQVREKKVRIVGEVNVPGEYNLEANSLRVFDIIKRAGGLTNFAYIKGATLKRRSDKDEQKSELKLELEKYVALKEQFVIDRQVQKNDKYELAVNRLDKKISEIEKRLKVEDSINAELQSSELKLESEKLKNERLSVNVTDSKYDIVTINFVNLISNENSRDNLILKDGDQIEIPRVIETVAVRGAVSYPNLQIYNPNYRFKSYVNSAGGFAETAIIEKSYVKYLNGTVKRIRKLGPFVSNPTIEPGSEIFIAVSQKGPKERVPFSLERVIGILSSALTISFLVQRF